MLEPLFLSLVCMFVSQKKKKNSTTQLIFKRKNTPTQLKKNMTADFWAPNWLSLSPHTACTTVWSSNKTENNIYIYIKYKSL